MLGSPVTGQLQSVELALNASMRTTPLNLIMLVFTFPCGPVPPRHTPVTARPQPASARYLGVRDGA